ncbi:MAG: DUF3800 domain-containing protein [Anaerolineaceae bacterium]|nr:DUF3800 domain-containing protein [Anaerolineaceae bacterium]
MDENGNHDLKKVDKNFPVFCLSSCIFENRYYNEVAQKKVDEFKNRFFGYTDVILHSRDIRKRLGEFSFLKNDNLRQDFYDGINCLISSLNYYIISVVIWKGELLSNYGVNAYNPYSFSLELIMERFCRISKNLGDCNGIIIAESRGKNEDKQLKETYKTLHTKGNQYTKNMGEIKNLYTEKKSKNLPGLQIADLVSYPIARKVISPNKENLSFEILCNKIYSGKNSLGYDSILGFGLKIFPDNNFDNYELRKELKNKTGFEPALPIE